MYWFVLQQCIWRCNTETNGYINQFFIIATAVGRLLLDIDIDLVSNSIIVCILFCNSYYNFGIQYPVIPLTGSIWFRAKWVSWRCTGNVLLPPHVIGYPLPITHHLTTHTSILVLAVLGDKRNWYAPPPPYAHKAYQRVRSILTTLCYIENASIVCIICNWIALYPILLRLLFHRFFVKRVYIGLRRWLSILCISNIDLPETAVHKFGSTLGMSLLTDT